MSTTGRERVGLLCCAAVAVVLTVQLVLLARAIASFDPGPEVEGPSAFVALLAAGGLCVWYVIAAVASWIAAGSAARRSRHARTNVLLAMSVVAGGEALVLTVSLGGSAVWFPVATGAVVVLAVLALASFASAVAGPR